MSVEVQSRARTIQSFNPATGELLEELPCASEDEVGRAVAMARAAQPAWKQIGVRARLAIIHQFQKLLLEKKSEIAEAITREAGKPYVEALLTEVQVVLDAARFCIATAQDFLAPQRLPHGNLAMKTKSGSIWREPHGVIGIISPWNYPFSIPATETLAALAMGNAVVLKPSELTPLVALELAKFLHEAGVPSNICQVVIGDGATGAALVDSDIDKLVFTGSVGTGKKIAQLSAAKLLPVVLELGGKDPMIVLNDADVDVASSAAVWGALVNAGQTCLSVERCYVHRSIYEEFLGACTRKISHLRVGNGAERGVDIGPLIHERQVSVVERHIQDATQRGAKLLAGGKRLPDVGANFYAPTLLRDVTHDMLIMQEETFGPVLPVMSFADDAEAVRLANDSVYGLAASIFTRDPARAKRIAAQLQAGTVMINDAISCFSISEAPHGGVKASGIGRTHGRFGFEEMVRVKYVDSDRLPGMKKIWWYKYGGALPAQIEGFLDMLFSKNLSVRIRGALRATGSLLRRDRL